MSETSSVPAQEVLTRQESTIGHAMLRQMGDATIQFALNQSGDRVHSLPAFTDTDFQDLTAEFAQRPKETLAWARESLFAIHTDDRMTPAEKEKRLDRYVDSYIDLTLKLDHAVYPNDSTVKVGIPDYIPDGFIDMGKYESKDPAERKREQIWIDKAAILERYKSTLTDIFSTDTTGFSSEKKQLMMASKLAKQLYFDMPVADTGRDGSDYLGGDKVKLSELSEGVCRHRALAFQVLGQAVGLNIKTAKGYVGGERHVANMLEVDGDWYIYDATKPDHQVVDAEKDIKSWRPGRYKIDAPPRMGESAQYTVTAPFSGKELTYSIRGSTDTHWYIDHP